MEANKKNNEVKDVADVTVDDLVPVVQELVLAVQRLQEQLRSHEHNARGETVIRL